MADPTTETQTLTALEPPIVLTPPAPVKPQIGRAHV